jgi:hypothetical protein
MSTAIEYRTDRNNNPTAFTTDVAVEARLSLGVDYEPGDSFAYLSAILPPLDSALYSALPPLIYYTAKLLGDPIATTIRVINAVTFYTKTGSPRWSYIALPMFVWQALSSGSQRDVIGFMYEREGGTAMRGLFPFYGQR